VIKDRSTLLVLGAGASADFGFSCGKDLLVKVCGLLEHSGRTDTPERLAFHMLAFDRSRLGQFRRALIESPSTSVDEFLETRTEFMQAGKAAMACILLPEERASLKVLHEPGKYHWYKYLLKHLHGKLDEFPQNRLGVVTFNYDRSFEFYLLRALLSKYGVPLERCVEVIKEIPIVHIYGQLGYLPEVPYGAALNATMLGICVRAIHVMHADGASDATSVQQARELVERAQRVYFLGFGYHPTNVERLGVAGDWAASRDTGGTVYELTPREVNVIANRIGRGFTPGQPTWKCLDWLRNADLS